MIFLIDILVMIYTVLMSWWFLIYWVALLVCWNILPEADRTFQIYFFISSIEIVWITYFHWCEVAHCLRVIISTIEGTIQSQSSTQNLNIVSAVVKQTLQILPRNTLEYHFYDLGKFSKYLFTSVMLIILLVIIILTFFLSLSLK